MKEEEEKSLPGASLAYDACTQPSLDRHTAPSPRHQACSRQTLAGLIKADFVTCFK